MAAGLLDLPTEVAVKLLFFLSGREKFLLAMVCCSLRGKLLKEMKLQYASEMLRGTASSSYSRKRMLELSPKELETECYRLNKFQKLDLMLAAAYPLPAKYPSECVQLHWRSGDGGTMALYDAQIRAVRFFTIRTGLSAPEGLALLATPLTAGFYVKLDEDTRPGRLEFSPDGSCIALTLVRSSQESMQLTLVGKLNPAGLTRLAMDCGGVVSHTLHRASWDSDGGMIFRVKNSSRLGKLETGFFDTAKVTKKRLEGAEEITAESWQWFVRSRENELCALSAHRCDKIGPASREWRFKVHHKLRLDFAGEEGRKATHISIRGVLLDVKTCESYFYLLLCAHHEQPPSGLVEIEQRPDVCTEDHVGDPPPDRVRVVRIDPFSGTEPRFRLSTIDAKTPANLSIDFSGRFVKRWHTFKSRWDVSREHTVFVGHREVSMALNCHSDIVVASNRWIGPAELCDSVKICGEEGMLLYAAGSRVPRMHIILFDERCHRVPREDKVRVLATECLFSDKDERKAESRDGETPFQLSDERGLIQSTETCTLREEVEILGIDVLNRSN